MNDELVIFIGDDTGGTFGRALQFTISVGEGVDLTGCSAEFVFDGITRTFAAPLVDGDTREIVYTAEETAAMQKGVRYAAFRVIDATGKVRTFTNTVRVRCTDIVAEVYPGTSAITVAIGATVAWSQISGKPNFATVATTGSYNDLTDKPEFPPGLIVDAELSTTSENPVQNKVVTEALNGKATSAQGAKADAALSRAEAKAGFTEWVCTSGTVLSASWLSGTWTFVIENTGTEYTYTRQGEETATSFDLESPEDTTRTRLPTMADVNAKLDKADVVVPGLDVGIGKAADAQKTALAFNLLDQGKADTTSLPYALVNATVQNVLYVPAYAFPIYVPRSGETIADNSGVKIIPDGTDGYVLATNQGLIPLALYDLDGTLSSVLEEATYGKDTASETSAPPNLDSIPTVFLTDRASNAVSLTADATLAFPAQTAGKARDFVVRLTLTETNNVVPSVTFPADVAYETEGGEWPDLTEAGTYIVRLTEVPKASVSETARFFLQCSSAVADATPPSAGGAA